MRIVVGMSGGLDSSATALILKQAGHDIIGVQMKYWAEGTCQVPLSIPMNKTAERAGNLKNSELEGQIANNKRKVVYNKCCSDESMLLTREVCDFLDIPFYALNIEERFRQSIVDPYLDAFEKGWIPNPCTWCNREIKFGALLEFAESIGATHIATGHYARLVSGEQGTELHEAMDSKKDQSYFLYELTPYQLDRMVLPLGTRLKDEVRALAEEGGLTAYKKTYKESQGLCFFSERTPEAFLERHGTDTLKTPGKLLTRENKEVGIHKGLLYYTIGQRRGLDIGGLSEPYFVLALDYENNTVIVGPKEHLYQQHAKIRIENLLISREELASLSGLSGRIRYGSTKIPCRLTVEGLGLGSQGLGREDQGAAPLATVQFSQPVYAVTPGQALVLYKDTRVIGGGTVLSNPILD